jgi:hypothetical protein
MEVVIEDSLGLLTKTQKTKIRRRVVEVWKDEEAFHDEVDGVLSLIHYPDERRYNFIRFDHSTIPDRLTLRFEFIPTPTAEEKREELRKKLHQKLKINRKVGVDPLWRAYDQLRTRLPANSQLIIPDPDKVRADPETYKNMMTMIPSQNPVHQYLSMFSL